MADHEDLRIRRTRTQIEQAFFELLKTKPFNELTVQDISQRAKVGRSTFYSHYYDKYDLLESLVRDYSTIFQDIVQQRFSIQTPEIGSNTVRVLIVALTQYRQNLLLLFNLHTETADLERNFKQILKKTAADYFAKIRLADRTNLPMDYLSELYASNVIMFLMWQLRHGKNDAVIRFGDRLQEFVLKPEGLDLS
ncbi:TetR/AcrR family transcriptional regulator [Secundilactobacillus kimchicus]|uniref:Transcriptional regulator n=1 Tax=Secundilactobacillus kimchicus JCM 15530 TaxID=1302272 RepID=A0A0R1HQU9_9LACO|nr:TetR family transcriptional regulator [Secundilactobacillus kimchicus]KRK46867.1 transcriptional regulator [Secundilactobacillus kimchicus JCM 15530]MBT9670633.1 TetR family transcriptional regulator [Secundilactobacillus kimchicus]